MVDLPEAKRILETTAWRPVRELGRGGGAVVFLCVQNHLIVPFEALANSVEQLTRQAAANAYRGVPQFAPAMEGLIERLVIGSRTGSALAAIKIPHHATGTELQRLAREMEAMRNYPHPALIRLLDVDESTPPRWFAMEAHLRGSLADERNRSRFSGKPLETLRAVRPIAEALAAIHRGNAVHRDVKPGNIFVADDGRLILGDLGIVIPSADADRLTAVGEVAHSRDWIPDWVQFGEEREYGPEVDVFALAKVIYFMLTGQKVMASQMYPKADQFLSKNPDVPSLGPVVSLLKSCIAVFQRDAATVRDGAMLLRQIDDLLSASCVSVRGLPLFSFLSMDDKTDCPLPQSIVPGGPYSLPVVGKLKSISLYVAARTKTLILRTRAYGSPFVLQLRFDQGAGAASGLLEDFGSPARHHPGTWTEPTLVVLDRALETGWHQLDVTGHGAAALSGLTLLYQ